MYKFLIALLLVVLAFTGCKKYEQPDLTEVNTDCDCASEVSAEFLMEEMTNFTTSARYTNTDSIFGNKNVRFYGLTDNATYKWYIGTEVLTTREVLRYFDNSFVGQTVPISLVVRKEPNSICFPNDDGYDSIVKYLTIAQINTSTFLDTTFLEGTYRMKSPLLPDSIDIIIDYRNYPPSNRRIDIYNYDGLGSNCLNRIPRPGLINFRQFWTYGDNTVTQSDYLQGTVYYPLEGQVEMNLTTGGYVSGNYVTELNHFQYRGRKL